MKSIILTWFIVLGVQSFTIKYNINPIMFSLCVWILSINVRAFNSILISLRDFYNHKQVQNVVQHFPPLTPTPAALTDMILSCSFFRRLMGWAIWIEIWILRQTCSPRIKPNWPQYTVLFINYSTLFVNMLLRIIVSMSMRDAGVVSLFLCIAFGWSGFRTILVS